MSTLRGIVKSEAKICKHCGNELPSSKQIFKIKTIDTPELTKELVNAYTKVRDKNYESRQEVVEKIAKKFDVTPTSIRVKLSVLGIYLPKVYIPINDGRSFRKGALVEKIAVRWGVQEEDIEKLLRVNKSVIELILDKAQMTINASTKDWEVSDHDSSKDALIQEIAENWRIDPKEIDTLAKANKRVIRYVLEDSRQFS